MTLSTAIKLRPCSSLHNVCMHAWGHEWTPVASTALSNTKLLWQCMLRRYPDFQHRFYPHLRHLDSNDAYCKYEDPLLQLFVSSLFLAGILGGMYAHKTCRMLQLLAATHFKKLMPATP